MYQLILISINYYVLLKRFMYHIYIQIVFKKKCITIIDAIIAYYYTQYTYY